MNAAPLRDVSDTARWVAYFRALESERPDALFHDVHARRLAGDRGRAIVERLPRGPLSWSLAVRTRVFDDLILEAVRTRGVDTVLDLAAGLDARPYRLSLPEELRWIEVDLPGIIGWKNEVLEAERPACIVERIPLDLTVAGSRRELFARVGRTSTHVLVVTEGLLVYLAPADVVALASDLAEAFPTGMWLLENIAPAILARQQRWWGKSLRAVNAPHQFAPSEGLAFFHRHGWEPRLTKSLMEEARRLGREMPFASTMRFFSSLIPGRDETFRQAVVYALLERADRGRS